jgi:hypothetical protein
MTYTHSLSLRKGMTGAFVLWYTSNLLAGSIGGREEKMRDGKARSRDGKARSRDMPQKHAFHRKPTDSRKIPVDFLSIMSGGLGGLDFSRELLVS